MNDATPSRPVAVVTGGGRGIGAAIAESLTARDHEVILTGRTEASLAETARRLGANYLVSDVTERGAAESVIDQVVERHGRVDLLVNNAGTAGLGGPLADADADSWWEVMSVNVYGPMVYMRAVLQHMIPNGHGTVFNICSYAAIHPTPGNSAYGASKAALARLTDSVAAEVASAGVTVLNLSPGLVETDMTRGVPIFESLPPEAWERIERIGELIAALSECSDLHALTGRFIHVSDDVDELFRSTETIRSEDLYELTMNGLNGPID